MATKVTVVLYIIFIWKACCISLVFI